MLVSLLIYETGVLVHLNLRVYGRNSLEMLKFLCFQFSATCCPHIHLDNLYFISQNRHNHMPLRTLLHCFHHPMSGYISHLTSIGTTIGISSALSTI